MTDQNYLATSLDQILNQYKNSFSSKIYNEENDDHDLLMGLFGISPDLKRENRQYWGRELGVSARTIKRADPQYCHFSAHFI